MKFGNYKKKVLVWNEWLYCFGKNVEIREEN
jgi:hypothetical protein